MKKILKGFTLAEVLITLGVVGVLSALTLPTLTTNIQKQQVGPALAKAINTLQTANNMAIQEGQVRRLNELADTPNAPGANSYFNEILRPYLKTTIVTQKPVYTTPNGTAIPEDNNIYQTTDGIYFTVQTSTRDWFNVDVDVNGAKGPNIGSRDLFRLRIYSNGDVMAFGSAEFAARTNMPNWNAVFTCNRQGVGSWFHCGGSIVDNNYKVIYY